MSSKEIQKEITVWTIENVTGNRGLISKNQKNIFENDFEIFRICDILRVYGESFVANKLPFRYNQYLHKRSSNHFCPMTSTNLSFDKKIFPDHLCKHRLLHSRSFVCNETFTIYAQDISEL